MNTHFASCPDCGATAASRDVIVATYSGGRVGALCGRCGYSEAPRLAAPTRTVAAGPVSRGALSLTDDLLFNVEEGLERLERPFKQVFGFVWQCISANEQGAIRARWTAAGGVSIWLVPSPLISPGSGSRVNACVVRDAGGLEFLVSADLVLTTGCHAVLAHEIAHLAGAHTELEAWTVAEGWLAQTGVPGEHCRAEIAALTASGGGP